jgi:hypothetical protein
MSELEKELEFVTNVIKLTNREKCKERQIMIGFFQRLCTMGDIALDIYQTEGARLPYFVCTLTIRICLELQTNLFQGAYHSAARSLRWLYETNLAGATACIKPSLLDEEFSDSAGLTPERFENWLDRYDNKQDAKLLRKKIFSSFGLPAEELDRLYLDLCKYVHISKASFDKELDWPKLQYIPEKFDQTFELTMKTLDLVLWMQSKMLLCHNSRTKEALKWFLKDKDSLNQHTPLTIGLISSLE